MAHVLSVTTGQISHPITLFILMKPDNRLFHGSLISLRAESRLIVCDSDGLDLTTRHSQHLAGFENYIPPRHRQSKLTGYNHVFFNHTVVATGNHIWVGRFTRANLWLGHVIFIQGVTSYHSLSRQ
jgi:hypothetical protein